MQTRESIARDILRLFIWFPLRWLVRVLPIHLGFFFFKLMGDLHFYVNGRGRERVSHTIQTFLNTDQKMTMEIVKKYYETHYLDRLHIFLYPKLMNNEIFKEYVYFENIELLERELKNGKGVLLVQPHFGVVQLTLLALGLSNYNPIQIGFPTDMGLSKIGRDVAFKYRLKYEAMLPPILPADRYLGKAYKHLVKGGVVLTTGDGAGGGVFLGEYMTYKFMDMERRFPLGPATWAIKTGAAFVPTFIIHRSYNRYGIVFEKPIQAIYNDYEKDRLEITKKFVSIMEEYVKNFPHCWHFWDELGESMRN